MTATESLPPEIWIIAFIVMLSIYMVVVVGSATIALIYHFKHKKALREYREAMATVDAMKKVKEALETGDHELFNEHIGQTNEKFQHHARVLWDLEHR